MVIHTFSIAKDEVIYIESQDQLEKNCLNPYKGNPNGCPNFGKNWSCPPYAPSIQETKNSLNTYPYLWLLVMEIQVKELWPNFIHNIFLRRKYKQITRTFNSYLSFLASQHKDWRVFFCSHCELCLESNYSKCSCPEKPCRHPNEIRLSPESCGIDLIKTLKQKEIILDFNSKHILRRIAMCATDQPIIFQNEYRNYLQYLKILEKFEG